MGVREVLQNVVESGIFQYVLAKKISDHCMSVLSSMVDQNWR